MASEMGVLPIPEEDIVANGACSPARCCWSTSRKAASFPTRRSRPSSRAAHPYAEWLNNTQIILEDLPPAETRPALSNLTLLDRQQAFGYTQEDLKS